jgi:ABC-2 type transport system permease protein
VTNELESRHKEGISGFDPFVFTARTHATVHTLCWLAHRAPIYPEGISRECGQSDHARSSEQYAPADSFFVPLVGLALGYNSIIGERETGTIKVILGLPNTRNEVVLGKFVGRGAVLLTAILVSYMAVGLTALALYDSFSVWIFATYTVLTVLYGLVYIAIGIALSASVDSQIRALSAAGFFYGLFLLVWDVFVAGIATATVGYTLPQTGGPPWLQALFMLNPSTAFAYATRAVIPEYREISILFDPTAFYLQDWVGFVVLALWITVPLALGYQRFNTDDLR